MEVRSRAPLRLGLAGGGTDLRAYSDKFGGQVVNATIARYVNVRISPRNDGKVCFKSHDTKETETFECSKKIEKGKMPLFSASYNRIMDLSGLDGCPITIEAVSDSPVGSGLGTSSTLVVTLLSGLAELVNCPIERYSLAMMAYEVEREDCEFSGGLQDQFAATFGGFNQLVFQKNRRVSVRPIPIEAKFRSELESRMLLYFTGRSRDSSQIIEDQQKNISGRGGGALDCLHEIKSEVAVTKRALMRSDMVGLIESINNGWESKKGTSDSITNNKISQILESLQGIGIDCAKVSGAGGGGFMFLISPLELRNRTIEILEEFGGYTGGCRFVTKGVEVWRQ